MDELERDVLLGRISEAHAVDVRAYRMLRSVIIAELDPADDDIAEEAILARAVQKAAAELRALEAERNGLTALVSKLTEFVGKTPTHSILVHEAVMLLRMTKDAGLQARGAALLLAAHWTQQYVQAWAAHDTHALRIAMLGLKDADKALRAAGFTGAPPAATPATE